MLSVKRSYYSRFLCLMKSFSTTDDEKIHLKKLDIINNKSKKDLGLIHEKQKSQSEMQEQRLLF